jgi:hypothetical protein
MRVGHWPEASILVAGSRIGRLLLAAWMAALLGGCIGAGAFQDRLRATSGELKYPHEAAPPERRPESIGLGAVTLSRPLPPSTTVTKTGGTFFPFLFVNIWTGDYRGTLGATELREDLTGFVRRSLAEDLERGGAHPYAEHDPSLQVDVAISKVDVTTPIHEHGNALFMFLWITYANHVSAGPIAVVLDGEVVVHRGPEELLRRPIQASVRMRGPAGKGWKTEDLTLSMVEGLSLAVKEFNRRVVQEVNAL